jgi:hypothetical protein
MGAYEERAVLQLLPLRLLRDLGTVHFDRRYFGFGQPAYRFRLTGQCEGAQDLR